MTSWKRKLQQFDVCAGFAPNLLHKIRLISPPLTSFILSSHFKYFSEKTRAVFHCIYIVLKIMCFPSKWEYLYGT